MQLEVFDYDERYHKRALVEWFKLRGLLASDLDDLPLIGYVAFIDGTEPVAAGFLRLMEGHFAMFDMLVSNPERAALERHVALDAVVHRILGAAASAKVKRIYAVSLDDGTIKRSLSHGFKVMPHKLIVREGF